MAITVDRRVFMRRSLMTIGATRLAAVGSVLEQINCSATRASIDSQLPSLAGATQWINSEALTGEALRGKVVLVQFCTYSCVNWLRTLPYVRAWADKYKNHGLVVLGAHTPEFGFEKNLDNVRRALKEMRVQYPIAVDNDMAIWNAFRNEYWPASYFADVNGRIRDHQFGEGDYDRSERIIQKLLNDAGSSDVPKDLAPIEARGIEAEADWANVKSPENYVGYARSENFSSPDGEQRDTPHVYAMPAQLRLNEWALSGDWTIGNQPTTLNKPNGKIAYRFHARDLNLVMGPPNASQSVRFRVTLDGKPPGAAHGLDVDEQGTGVAKEQRLFQLVRQPMPIVDREFKIEFLDPGVQAFSFTFG
jgi:thiol-disulfide isomerase/thioredoxin